MADLAAFREGQVRTAMAGGFNREDAEKITDVAIGVANAAVDLMNERVDAFDNEAMRLNALGISAFVVHYRLSLALEAIREAVLLQNLLIEGAAEGETKQ